MSPLSLISDVNVKTLQGTGPLTQQDSSSAPTPRHSGDEAGRCGDHWECHQCRYVTCTKMPDKILQRKAKKIAEKQQRTGKSPSAADLLCPLSPMGHGLGQEQFTPPNPLRPVRIISLLRHMNGKISIIPFVYLLEIACASSVSFRQKLCIIGQDSHSNDIYRILIPDQPFNFTNNPL